MKPPGQFGVEINMHDFSKLIEVFERHRVSFVSVTQQFNTTTSMGRLMLNVLLSFAQFEREVTGERIRDKIAASKAKGMWMGGVVPLGYLVEDRKLHIDEVEAGLVRRIFEDFVKCRSTTEMVKQLAADGLLNKTGKPFSKQMLYQLLHNRIYLGEIQHKDKFYPGQHEAIIEQPLWDAAHAILAQNNHQRRSETWQRRQPEALLMGLLYAPNGEKFTPSFTCKPNGKRYRYYIPNRKVSFGAEASQVSRVPAEPIEQMVLAQVHAALQAPEMMQAVWEAAKKLCPTITEPEVVIPLRRMANVWNQLFPDERQRIVQLLIEKVVLRDDGIEILWHEAGWPTLAGEMCPGTLGAELLEQEEALA
jgi:site-specific DNA recombinase